MILLLYGGDTRFETNEEQKEEEDKKKRNKLNKFERIL